MQKIIGVTDLQRNFRSVFDEVTKVHMPYVLTRGSRPEAAIVPYEEFTRFLAWKEQEIVAEFDRAMMRLADFVVALPFLLFMILFKVAFGIRPGESGVVPMLLAMVLLGWPASARLVRGQVMAIRDEPYVQAARLMGAGTPYLVLRHMVPNVLGVLLVALSFAIPGAIFTEAFLSFIGLGVAPPTPSWGSLCNDGIRSMLAHPHELAVPAAFISITVLAFNLLGDGLRDALDTRAESP